MITDSRNLVIGYHGCEKSVAADVLCNRTRITTSQNAYDWLGSGIYFWENDPTRALEFATEIKKCKEPFIVGAIIDLGFCLDLTCRESLNVVKMIWENTVKESYEQGNLRENLPGRRGETGELLRRYLDCHVIEALHKYNDEHGYEQYDSVRAGFWEGNPIYPTAGFFDKNHIQICVRNYDCIIGYFLPQGGPFTL